MSDIFSWYPLFYRSNPFVAPKDSDAKREVPATSPPPTKRDISDSSNNDDSPRSRPPNTGTATKRLKTSQQKIPSKESSPLKRKSSARSKKSTSPRSKSKQDSEEWLQGMQRWLLHANDGPKLTRKLLRQIKDSVQALASGQGLPAMVYSGGAVFLPHQPINWATVDLKSLKEAAQCFCQQEAVSMKRTCDVFVGPMEYVQLYRNSKAGHL